MSRNERQTIPRYANQFHVKAAGSPNILMVGPVTRAMAKTQALVFAAWLVTFAGDAEKFMEILIDVWNHRYGEDQIPSWLRKLVPDWEPHVPPVVERRAAPVPVETRARRPAPAARPRPSPVADLPRMPARGGGGGGGADGGGGNGEGRSRLTLEDGTPLDGEGIQQVAEAAQRTMRGEAPPPKRLPDVGSMYDEGEPEEGNGAVHGEASEDAGDEDGAR